MFEKFNVKSFYVATEAVLSLFSTGVTSGVIAECGDEVSRAVPVFEGCVSLWLLFLLFVVVVAVVVVVVVVVMAVVVVMWW